MSYFIRGFWFILLFFVKDSFALSSDNFNGPTFESCYYSDNLFTDYFIYILILIIIKLLISIYINTKKKNIRIFNYLLSFILIFLIFSISITIFWMAFR